MKSRREFIKVVTAATTPLVLPGGGSLLAFQHNPGPIMAIAAHPGDGMFTMGAAVAQHINNGGSGTFLSLSLGEKGHNSIPPDEYGSMQQKAMEASAGKIGAKAHFLDYPDAEIPFNKQISLEVCDVIREVKPSIIITHWQGSWHKDHKNCFEIVQDARFYAGLNTLQRQHPAHYTGQLYYAENWEDMEAFQQDTYVDITPVFDQWLSACELFPMWRGETGFRYNDYYHSLATMRGCLAGSSRAVALMSEKGQQVRKLKEF